MADLIRTGKIEPIYTRSGHLTGYRLEIHHTGLHEHRLLRAPDEYVLRNKAQTQISSWETKWQRLSSKTAALENTQKSKEQAEILSRQASGALEEARTLLLSSLGQNNSIKWDALKDKRKFYYVPNREFPRVELSKVDGEPIRAIQESSRTEPTEESFKPSLTILHKIITPLRRKRYEEARRLFERAHSDWLAESQEIARINHEANRQFQAASDSYSDAKRRFEAQIRSANDQVADLKARYEAKESTAIVAVSELILNASTYPDWISKDFTISYNSDTKTIILDYNLPRPESIPSLSKVVYISARNEMKSSLLTDNERVRLFDSVLYQIALRSVYELFSGDACQAIDAIVFNGWLSWTNKATGSEETGCLLSVQAKKSEFSKIDLSKIDEKACFRALKGVSAAKLSGITPIAPIVKINTDDPRFVASHEVTSSLDESINLAAINWEEFEHLVREIFEKEFASDGGEVKVTRASADGGVDAVVFDPHPIRGGKIVIQAKRYTATVGVSAVRDLYGTMMNEGAMKGILVTTSDYGPDTYAFAKDKPISLLNGGNLLHLLERHGHKARIDLAEARRLREAG